MDHDCLQIPLFEDNGKSPDYEELIDRIFEFNEVITWW
jgi:hypothetical protein